MTESKELFSSPRERRLWFWAAAVVFAVFATIGLASTFAEALGNQTVAAAVFLGSMLLIATTVLTQGLKLRPGGVEIGIGLGVAAVYAMLLLRMTIPERSHLIEYSVMAAFIYEALLERSGQGRRVPAPALISIGITALIGAIDEIIQAFIPSRVFDVVDIAFNAMAAVLAVAGMALLGWARHKRAPRQQTSA